MEGCIDHTGTAGVPVEEACIAGNDKVLGTVVGCMYHSDTALESVKTPWRIW
jgi:hypothetical protein